MSPKEQEKISPEAYEKLEALLVGYYQKPYEESYQILSKKVEARLLSKQINIKYRALLINDLEDLIQAVFYRLASVNSESLTKTGEEIRNPELMAYRITGFVFREKMKEIRKRLKEQSIDDDDSEKKPIQLRQSTSHQVQAIIEEIIQECYDACLESLRTGIRDIFQSYYPKIQLEAKELVARRRRLAIEKAGLTEAQAQSQTPEQEHRIINNLQKNVHTLRGRHVEDCVRECVEAKKSRHMRLNYLSQQ